MHKVDAAVPVDGDDYLRKRDRDHASNAINFVSRQTNPDPLRSRDDVVAENLHTPDDAVDSERRDPSEFCRRHSPTNSPPTRHAIGPSAFSGVKNSGVMSPASYF